MEALESPSMAGCLARFEKRPPVGLEGALNAREGNRKALTHEMRFVGRGSACAGPLTI
jgi:hypothetical protein